MGGAPLTMVLKINGSLHGSLEDIDLFKYRAICEQDPVFATEACVCVWTCVCMCAPPQVSEALWFHVAC